MPTRSTSPARRSPPMAARRSPASPRPAVKAPSPIPWATLSLCTTSQPARGLQSGSTPRAGVRALADTSPARPRIHPLLAEPISAFKTVSNTGTFIRDVQITGDFAGNGIVYIAGMNEGGGGFPHNDNNLIFKSTDGGVTFAAPFKLNTDKYYPSSVAA